MHSPEFGQGTGVIIILLLRRDPLASCALRIPVGACPPGAPTLQAGHPWIEDAGSASDAALSSPLGSLASGGVPLTGLRHRKCTSNDSLCSVLRCRCWLQSRRPRQLSRHNRLCSCPAVLSCCCQCLRLWLAPLLHGSSELGRVEALDCMRVLPVPEDVACGELAHLKSCPQLPAAWTWETRLQNICYHDQSIAAVESLQHGAGKSSSTLYQTKKHCSENTFSLDEEGRLGNAPPTSLQESGPSSHFT